MIDQIRDIIREYFWYNTGPVVFTWGTAVVREGMVRFVLSSLALAWALCVAAWVLALCGRWRAGR